MSRIVVFDGERVDVQIRTVPTRHEGEALVRLRLAGICSTDLALMRGYKNFQGIMGHEFVGDVLEGPEAWLNRRVVGEINITCGTCDLCQRGLETHCRQRKVLGISGDYDGAFADAFRLPVRNLRAVPDDLTDEQAVFAEPMAAAIQVLEQIHLKPTQPVLVLGTGRLGMLVAQVLHQAGIPVTGVVHHQNHAERLQRWGINAKFRQELGDQFAEVVVDCTGKAGGFTDALKLLRPRGKLILKSTYGGLPEVDLSKVVVDEITVIGSRCGPFDVALRLLSRLPVLDLIDGEYNLSDAPRALEHAAQSGILKILLRP